MFEQKKNDQFLLNDKDMDQVTGGIGFEFLAEAALAQAEPAAASERSKGSPSDPETTAR